MVLQHFGLKHYPLGKAHTELWDDGSLTQLKERFTWLLESPGVGLLTGEAGVGKTAALRQLTQALNPHRYQVIYLPETDFGRLDLYRSLALALGLEPVHRRAALWRDIKARIQELADGKGVLPLWIIDEAQNLPVEFFRDLPAFLNFAFDSRDLMAVWLLGHPRLAYTLERAPYAALASRIQVYLQLKPIAERERFKQLVDHAFTQAGAQHTLLSDSGLELLRQASQGLPRQGRSHPQDQPAAGRTQGPQSPARRGDSTGHRGADMSSLPFTLPEDLPAPVAFALFELFRDLTDALWQQYGHELIDLAMEERNQYLASQQEFDFNDDIQF